MKTMTLRGIDESLEKALQKRAQNSKESINKTILNILRKETGLQKEKPFKEHYDLDELAGTWSDNDENEFRKKQSSLTRLIHRTGNEERIA